MEMIKIRNMKGMEKLEDEIVRIDLFSKRNHQGYYTNNLFFLKLNLNLNTQLQRSKL